MTLQVIGVGFGRTGTESLKRALEQLGHGPCYHMYEVAKSRERVDTWCRIAAGAAPDWDAVFDGFAATVDWPGAAYWRALVKAYPDAKVILGVRSAESWFASMEKTILPRMIGPVPQPNLSQIIVRDVVFGGRTDRDTLIDTYNAHIDAVQAAVPADRLLTYELGSGWGPLCAFLGVPVPDTPYPSGNDQDDFAARVGEFDRADFRSGPA